MNTMNSKSMPVSITPLMAVDIIILYNGNIVLIKRKNPPFQDKFALPGGFIEVGETVEEAAAREAKEETGLDIKIHTLVGVYSEPTRDPRGHIISICFLASGDGLLKSGSDAKDIKLFNLSEIPNLAFDHNQMIANIKDIIRNLNI